MLLTSRIGKRFRSLSVTRDGIFQNLGSRSPETLIPGTRWYWVCSYRHCFQTCRNVCQVCGKCNCVCSIRLVLPSPEDIRYSELHQCWSTSISKIRTGITSGLLLSTFIVDCAKCAGTVQGNQRNHFTHQHVIRKLRKQLNTLQQTVMEVHMLIPFLQSPPLRDFWKLLRKAASGSTSSGASVYTLLHQSVCIVLVYLVSCAWTTWHWGPVMVVASGGFGSTFRQRRWSFCRVQCRRKRGRQRLMIKQHLKCTWWVVTIWDEEENTMSAKEVETRELGDDDEAKVHSKYSSELHSSTARNLLPSFWLFSSWR